MALGGIGRGAAQPPLLSDPVFSGGLRCPTDGALSTGHTQPQPQPTTVRADVPAFPPCPTMPQPTCVVETKGSRARQYPARGWFPLSSTHTGMAVSPARSRMAGAGDFPPSGTSWGLAFGSVGTLLRMTGKVPVPWSLHCPKRPCPNPTQPNPPEPPCHASVTVTGPFELRLEDKCNEPKYQRSNAKNVVRTCSSVIAQCPEINSYADETLGAVGATFTLRLTALPRHKESGNRFWKTRVAQAPLSPYKRQTQHSISRYAGRRMFNTFPGAVPGAHLGAPKLCPAWGGGEQRRQEPGPSFW